MTTIRTLLFDVETDGLDYTKIHCIAVKDPDTTGDPLLFTSVGDFEAWALINTDEDTDWVAHNGCGFDYWVINELTCMSIKRDRMVDTSVLSKLKDYRRFHTHSLREISTGLGVILKGEYTGGWDTYTPEMGVYCMQDVKCMIPIWRELRHMLTDYPDACYYEHMTALIAAKMQKDGFQFNRRRAELLHDEVVAEMSKLEDSMQKEWPPELVEDRRIKWRMTKNHVPHAACIKAQAKAPKWDIVGDELVLYDYKKFNPASSKDRVDKLWDSGWSPYVKTKGHNDFLRERKSRWR